MGAGRDKSRMTKTERQKAARLIKELAMTCPECKGTGKVEGGNCEPPHITCPTCNGTGKVKDA